MNLSNGDLFFRVWELWLCKRFAFIWDMMLAMKSLASLARSVARPSSTPNLPLLILPRLFLISSVVSLGEYLNSVDYFPHLRPLAHRCRSFPNSDCLHIICAIGLGIFQSKQLMCIKAQASRGCFWCFCYSLEFLQFVHAKFIRTSLAWVMLIFYYFFTALWDLFLSLIVQYHSSVVPLLQR